MSRSNAMANQIWQSYIVLRLSRGLSFVFFLMAIQSVFLKSWSFFGVFLALGLLFFSSLGFPV